MDLLRDITASGYPLAYLLTRVQGRRRYLADDYRALLASAAPLAAMRATPYRQSPVPGGDQEIWSGLLREFAWLYAQMERSIREIFAPVFFHFELHTVSLCLWQRASGDGASCEGLLLHTLLSRQLKQALEREQDVAATVDELDRLFASTDEQFKGLREAYRARGLAGFQAHLNDRYLEQLAKRELHPVVGRFFSRLIDVRNAVTLAKQRRWGITDPAAFLNGGTIRKAVFLKAKMGEQELAGALVRKLTGTVDELAAGNLESLLLAGVSRLVRGSRWDPDGIGLLLDYLWSAAMDARNLSLILHGEEIDRDLLYGELIR